MLEPWAKSVEEGTGGRVKIEIYPAMSLGGAPPQLVRQVADGVVDIIWTVNGYTPGLFPRSEVFELPTIFTNDITATNLAMRAMFDEYLAPEYEAMHVLFNHVHAGQAIQMAKDPVRTVADTAGQEAARAGADRQRRRRGDGRDAGDHAGARPAAGAGDQRGRRRADPLGDHPGAQPAGRDPVPDRGPGQVALRHHDLPGVDEQGALGIAARRHQGRCSTPPPTRTGCARSPKSGAPPTTAASRSRSTPATSTSR